MTALDELTQVAVNRAAADVYLFGFPVQVAAVLASLVIGLLQVILFGGALIQADRLTKARERQLAQRRIDSEQRHRATSSGVDAGP